MRSFLMSGIFTKLAYMFVKLLVTRELRKELKEKAGKKEIHWHKEPNGVKWRNINGRQEMIIPSRF